MSNGWAGVVIHGPVHHVVAVPRCVVKPAEEAGVDVGQVDREDRVSLRHQKLCHFGSGWRGRIEATFT